MDEERRVPPFAIEALDALCIQVEASDDGLLMCDVLTVEKYALEVDTNGGFSHGAVIAGAYGVTGTTANATVAVDIDIEAFRDMFFEGLDDML